MWATASIWLLGSRDKNAVQFQFLVVMAWLLVEIDVISVNTEIVGNKGVEVGCKVSCISSCNCGHPGAP